MSADKPILTISVAGELLNVHPRTLMLYEKAELIKPHRTPTERRLFSPKDLDSIQFIIFLTQEKGINLAGVRTVLEAIEKSAQEGVNLKKLLFPEFKPTKLI